MTREFYDFGNFRQFQDDEGEEDGNFKNIWESPKDENPFYEKYVIH